MTEENPAELEKEVAHQADEMEHQADESRFGVATSILAPAPTVSECAGSVTQWSAPGVPAGFGAASARLPAEAVAQTGAVIGNQQRQFSLTSWDRLRRPKQALRE